MFYITSFYVFLNRVYLIGSTPGRYQGPAMEKWGHLRLRKVMFLCDYTIFLCDSSLFPFFLFPLRPRLKNDWCSWKSIVRLQDALEMYSSCLIYWGNSDNTGRVRCWIGLCKIQKLSQEPVHFCTEMKSHWTLSKQRFDINDWLTQSTHFTPS